MRNRRRFHQPSSAEGTTASTGPDSGNNDTADVIETPLTFGRIARFWGPLAATWVMMSIEGPSLTAVIARMAEPKFNLAAYGVAFHIALFIEAPIIMILSAATALVKDYGSFVKLRNYTYSLNAAITLLMLVIVIPGIFYPFADHVLDLDPEISHLTHIGAMILIPWPGAIGFRRFWQGILIREGLTRLVGWGTVVRLLAMAGSAAIMAFVLELDGIIVGTGALSFGVISEAVAARIMVAGSLRKLHSNREKSGEPPTYRAITKFYWPLALTSMIGLAAQPFVTGFLSHSRFSLESLAVWPIVGGFVFLFRGVGLAWQEVVIALTGDKFQHYLPIRNFTIMLATVTSGLLTLIAFTPLSELWYGWFSGLSPQLTEFAVLGTKIMALLPAMSVLISFQRGLLVISGRTGPVSTATAIEVGMIVVVMLVAISWLDAIGVIAAAAALVIGRIFANAYLEWDVRRAG